MVGDPRQSRPAAVDPGRGQPPLDLKPETRGNGAAARAVANGSDMDAITSNHRTGRAIPGTVSPPPKARTCQSARAAACLVKPIDLCAGGPKNRLARATSGHVTVGHSTNEGAGHRRHTGLGSGLKERSGSPDEQRLRGSRSAAVAPDGRGIPRPEHVDHGPGTADRRGTAAGGEGRWGSTGTASDRSGQVSAPSRPTVGDRMDARPPAARSAAPVATKEDRSCDETPSSVRCQRSSWAPSP
jgi:hypothetical protein